MKDEIKEKIKGYVYNEDDEKKILDYITNLQEEKRKLKAELELYKDNHNYLNDRIDKAIEYITTEQLYTNYQWGKSQYVKILKDLLNILQGKSDE